MKKCNKCTLIKFFEKFGKNKSNVDGYSNNCKQCRKEWDKAYYTKHKEKALKASRKWQQNNRKRIQERSNSRYYSDIQYRLAYTLRRRIQSKIKYSKKQGSAVKDLGCTLEKLRTHLEKQFKEGMSWSNYGEWHIDHIKPLSKFDLTNREQFLEACHYTNLQPLWAKENLQKHCKYSTGLEELEDL